MWSHVRSTKSLTADDFFCEKRRRPRPRFFEHNNYNILTTAVAKGRPPWRSIIWNESARDRPTWSAIFLCGTKTVPHASYYVRAGSEPEIALARGLAHNQPQKSTKSTLTPVLPPQLLPTQSTYPQCNAPLPLLPEASPQSSIKMTSPPQHKTGCYSRSRCQHQNSKKYQ